MAKQIQEFLKYVWSFFNIMHEKVKLLFPKPWNLTKFKASFSVKVLLKSKTVMVDTVTKVTVYRYG